MKKVLFVCHGNIMRSAYAEAYFRKRFAAGGLPVRGFSASSAGVFATAGRAADPRTLAIGRELELPLAAHKARAISHDLVNETDLICVMDAFNEVVCVSRFPHAKDRIVFLGSFARSNGGSAEISDPFTGAGEQARQAFDRVRNAVDALLSEITHDATVDR